MVPDGHVLIVSPRREREKERREGEEGVKKRSREIEKTGGDRLTERGEKGGEQPAPVAKCAIRIHSSERLSDSASPGWRLN